MYDTLLYIRQRGVKVREKILPITAMQSGAKIIDMYREKNIHFSQLLKYNYVDDFMRENIDGRLNIYGTKVIPAVVYIENAYRVKQRVFLTSNFAPEHLLKIDEDLYHAVSRIYELCNVVRLNADDFHLKQAKIFEF